MTRAAQTEGAAAPSPAPAPETDRRCECASCGWEGPESAVDVPLEAVPDLEERLDPGGEVPAGMCRCGALVYLAAARPQVVIVIEEGLVSSVYGYATPKALQVFVVDRDTEGADPGSLDRFILDGEPEVAFCREGDALPLTEPFVLEERRAWATATFADHKGERREWSGAAHDHEDALEQVRMLYPGASKIDVKVAYPPD